MNGSGLAQTLRLRLVALFIAGAVVLSCDNSIEPGPPDGPAPRQDIEILSPAPLSQVGDTLVTVTGIIRVPSGGTILSAAWGVSAGAVAGSGPQLAGGAFFVQGRDTPVDSIPFSVTLDLSPGLHTFFVTMRYHDENVRLFDLLNTRTFDVYKKPTYRIDAGMADTLFQRSLLLEVSHDGLTADPWYANVVLNPGTANEKTIDNAPSPSTTKPWIESLSPRAKRLYFPDTVLGMQRSA